MAPTTSDVALPDRITPDAIIEALIEMRFETADLPEIVLGRLIDAAHWMDYAQSRLPAADIPQAIREADPDLRYQPLLELRRQDGLRAVKVGGRVLSYHVTTSYPGWLTFQHEIQGVIEHIFEKTRDISFVRLGFRYINAFYPEKHYIYGIEDTSLEVSLRGEKIVSSLNLNYVRRDGAHLMAVRIATPDIVAGTIAPGFSLLCDIDLSTIDRPLVENVKDTMSWIDKAHDLGKAEFFRLISEQSKRKLMRSL